MRIAPICQPVRVSELFFIKIKELPQITESRIKMSQFRNFCFDIEGAKVRKD